MTEYKIHNKSDKPDNVIEKENDIYLECLKIEHSLPDFLQNYFLYLKGNVLPMTRLAYLHDVRFFFMYLIEHTSLTSAKETRAITLEEIRKITAKDINRYLDYCRKYTVEENGKTVIYENNNKTLARKRSVVSVLFKQLYRDELLSKNITDSFDPIRVPKQSEREIKALQDDEVMVMLDAVTTGAHLTTHERHYWEKTRFRDKAILILFLTYGLRLSELQQLNISSFNFSRGEFKVYRKRDKESLLPINKSVEITLQEYIKQERCFLQEEGTESENDALFLSLQGKRMTARAIRDLVKKYTAIALSTTKKNGYSPHKLRATAATSLIGRGNSIYDVQELMDHEQVTTTQLYAAHKMNIKRDLVKDMEWELERKDND